MSTPRLMMPMAGDQLELRYPDGRVVPAPIASFGVEVWRDSDGSFYMNADPSDPIMTLTITSDADLSETPAGTDVLLSDAKFAPESNAP